METYITRKTEFDVIRHHGSQTGQSVQTKLLTFHSKTLIVITSVTVLVDPTIYLKIFDKVLTLSTLKSPKFPINLDFYVLSSQDDGG